MDPYLSLMMDFTALSRYYSIIYSIVEVLQHCRAITDAVIPRQCCKVHIAMYIYVYSYVEVLQHCRGITDAVIPRQCCKVHIAMYIYVHI